MGSSSSRRPAASVRTARTSWCATGGDFAARVPLHETFRVYVDEHGVLRTDHELRLWNAWAVRLHYKLERAS